jgi:hypothetical protein
MNRSGRVGQSELRIDEIPVKYDVSSSVYVIDETLWQNMQWS